MVGYSTASSPYHSAFVAILHNLPLMCALVAFTAAQVAKVFTHRIVTSKWDIKRLVSSGGMPSSHSALIVGVVTGVGMSSGLSDPLFAVATCMAMIVMYDACGVRLQAGKHAEALNHIVSATQSASSGQNSNTNSSKLHDTRDSNGGPSDKSSSIALDLGDDSIAIDISNGSNSALHRKQSGAGQNNAGSFSSNPFGSFPMQSIFPLSFYEKKFKESIGHTPMQVESSLASFLILNIEKNNTRDFYLYPNS